MDVCAYLWRHRHLRRGESRGAKRAEGWQLRTGFILCGSHIDDVPTGHRLAHDLADRGFLDDQPEPIFRCLLEGPGAALPDICHVPICGLRDCRHGHAARLGEHLRQPDHHLFLRLDSAAHGLAEGAALVAVGRQLQPLQVRHRDGVLRRRGGSGVCVQLGSRPRAGEPRLPGRRRDGFGGQSPPDHHQLADVLRLDPPRLHRRPPSRSVRAAALQLPSGHRWRKGHREPRRGDRGPREGGAAGGRSGAGAHGSDAPGGNRSRRRGDSLRPGGAAEIAVPSAGHSCATQGRLVAGRRLVVPAPGGPLPFWPAALHHVPCDLHHIIN
mmetsp:Transcript_107549/g.304044  ORF Transcript_107549/g.304044 Transcript_107549/m.304044 type:complete len:326 (+) Transcript_107549:1158-2135(+)